MLKISCPRYNHHLVLKMVEAQRNSIALKDKLSILNDLETGKKTQVSIYRQKNLSKSTVAMMECLLHAEKAFLFLLHNIVFVF